ncbi:trihelix transcription factor GT-2-like [Durio zibethinus]|uniref:Trihelix transcription factor GT-2-like n=1 Tax=Durio zibethinus TaxID=66656 RepID=A0A6P6B8M8_DURZI|nr:trihelix transcription factor GT-2-like [Durio zibethinus]XP_022773390.1 trihelix transcription factor GT-2-like [Durio zibethinus]
MLGGGGTSASVVGSSGGGDTGGNIAAAAAAAATVSSSSEAAITMLGSNENNNNSNSGEDDRGRIDEGDRSFGGNRWPRQETLALLKIRSDMDVTFRDASIKGPLWEEVSRKLAELGYQRSAKKCKEKFENVYKYHKRTKDGRTGKSDGKTYRFFDQLEALENHPSIQSPAAAAAAAPPPPQLKPQAQTAMPAANPPSLSHVTVPSTTLVSLSQNIAPPNTNLTVPSLPSTNPTIPSFPNILADLMSNSTSSSTSSDLKLEDRRKRKRKWKDFFERKMKEMIQKQEEMQKNFLEAIEKREHERMVSEEAWRMQEMARINREREILAQERLIAAEKNAAVLAFLQKLSEQQNPEQAQNNPLPSQQPQPPLQASPQPLSAVAPAAPPAAAVVPASAPPLVPLPTVNLDVSKTDNGDPSYTPSSSRWPKVEVEALIKLRSSLEAKYQDSGPKGPLWEEISAAMKKLGYNRNAKRCKEKWENINKYFKKVKDSNKKRPEDSKTCPYFYQLDVLYREKNKHDSSSNQLKPENSVPLMVRPVQQWPPSSSEPDQRQHDHVMEDVESEQNQDEDDNDCYDEEVDEGAGGGFKIVASKPVSMGTGD